MTSPTQANGLGLPYATIAQMAETIAKSTGIRSVQDFEPIIVGMGGTVARLDKNAWFSPDAPCLLVAGPQKFTVYLSQENSPLDRLLFACSIGHYILHTDEGRTPELFKRYAKDGRSVEALWFGMALIISDEAFALAEQHRDIEDNVLAGLFQTTPQLIALKRKLRSSAKKAAGHAAQPLDRPPI